MQRCKWEDNIEMNLREMGCEDVDWIRLSHGTVAGCCEHDT